MTRADDDAERSDAEEWRHVTDQVRLGAIGLGKMGAPMAKRLVDWPGGVTVFDVRAEAMEPLADAGATPADSLADVAAADIISVTVLNDEQVREVVTELAASAEPGTVIAIHSTISDTTAVEMAQELEPQGIHIVDAPVSGGGRAAKKGELATMVGATDEAFAMVEEPFSKWASLVIHAGQPGAGTWMKLARNMLHYISFAAACEASNLAEVCGLNLQDLGKVVRHTDAITGGAGSIMFRDDMKPIAPDSFLYQPFLHARVLGEKDLSLALTLGQSHSVELPLTALALERLADGLGVPHTTATTKE